VKGPELHRLDRVLDRRERRHQDDLDVGRLRLDAAEHLQAVAVGQPVVEEHEVDLARNLRDRVGRRGRFENVVAVAPQPLPKRPADERLVVDDEDGGGGHPPSVYR